MKNERKSPLSVVVKNGKLIISIGVETLAHAFNYSDYAQPLDSTFTRQQGLLVVNKQAMRFARDVKEELEREEEDGTTPVHVLLDKMVEKAAENGSQAVIEVMDGDKETPA